MPSETSSGKAPGDAPASTSVLHWGVAKVDGLEQERPTRLIRQGIYLPVVRHEAHEQAERKLGLTSTERGAAGSISK